MGFIEFLKFLEDSLSLTKVYLAVRQNVHGLSNPQ